MSERDLRERAWEAAGVLDPADRDPGHRARLGAWLRLQAALYLDPVLARERLAGGAGPERVLASLRSERDVLAERPLAERIDRLQRQGVRALPLGAPGYPARLEALRDAAPLLLVRGDPCWLQARCVAIVGSRAATSYGREVAAGLAADLAARGLVVVSGLATGIDAAAHRGALEAGGSTLAFQACGPERVYPRRHRALADRIAGRGAIVTEMPPGTPPRAPYFPLRNRLIAGLSEVVIVVEARLRSGSLVTARRALDQGGSVMAVPGPVTAATSAGTNALIRDGAAPVLAAEDVLRELRIDAPPRPANGTAGAPDEGGGGAVLRALAREPRRRDDLARELGVAPQDLALELFELELAGRIETDRDGRLRLRARGPRSRRSGGRGPGASDA